MQRYKLKKETDIVMQTCDLKKTGAEYKVGVVTLKQQANFVMSMYELKHG